MNARGILVTNLGSPDSPDTASVRAFLNEFLMDRRVITLPYPLRRTLVSLILKVRPQRTATAYQQIWTEKGSPLQTYTSATAQYIKEKLDFPVAIAMRYGRPSFEEAYQELKHVDEILLLSPYPQYAESTTLSMLEHARDIFSSQQLLVTPPYFEDPVFLKVQANLIKEHLPENADHLVISFHGIPVSHLSRADPTGLHCQRTSNCCETPSIAHKTCYRHQCFQTARALQAQIGIPTSISFSSRLGRNKWLEPYTANHVVDLAKQGFKHIGVTCPAFISDNLETLYEIAIETNEIFTEAGGSAITLIPCMNTEQEWLDRIVEWCKADSTSMERVGENP